MEKEISMYRVARRSCAVLLALAAVQTVRASELDALAISRNVQQLHMPYGTILDPVFGSPDPASASYSQVVSYAKAGDSAIWTGHYLAAEAFRYQVTRSPEALDSVRRALAGIRSLLDVTGSDVLARCLVPADSPYAAAIQQEEGGHGIYYTTFAGRNYFWIGNTSRDQYAGVMFGLGVAYDQVDDPAVRDFIRQDVTRILKYLLAHQWNVVMPDGRSSTTFALRADQQLSFLQIGRRIDPATFASTYATYRQTRTGMMALAVAYDNVDDHEHYFKFNLNYITFYNLVRLEEETSPFRAPYLQAYDALRRRTERHGTVGLLNAWLTRSRRDSFVDLRATYPACGTNRACNPVPIAERPNTDFLWQRTPFQLYGGGIGTIETAGIDYILPYWMGRFYGVVQ
jgi:hypothetical protein